MRSASPRRSRSASSPGELERVVWSEPDALAWAPVSVAEELRERLWDEGPTAILVSATLTTGEDAGFVRRRLGLSDASEAVVGSPYDFAEQALLYLPRSMPDPRSDAFLERAADEIVALLALSEGRALVLTSSYRALEAYRERVRGRVPYDVLVQGEAPRERLLARFRAEVGSVLIATSTFWQGVDVPGESLSLLVIDKLPFSAPGDPLHEARCEAVEQSGGDWFSDYALPTATLQLRQGLRPPDPQPQRPRRRRDPRSAAADARLRARVHGRAAALPGRRGSRRGRGVLRRRGCRFRLNGRPRWRRRSPALRRRRAASRRRRRAPGRARRASRAARRRTRRPRRAPAGDPLRRRRLGHRRADRRRPARRARRRQLGGEGRGEDARRRRLHRTSSIRRSRARRTTRRSTRRRSRAGTRTRRRAAGTTTSGCSGATTPSPCR